VKYPIDEVLPLVAQATASRAEVRSEDPDTLRITVDKNPPLTFQLAKWKGESTDLGAAPTLWILRRPTRRELDQLRAAGQSYVALSGAVRISAPGLIVDRTDLKVTRKPTHLPRRSAFSDRASLIPRWLFRFRSAREWQITALAKHAGVSPSVASYSVRDLEARGLVTTREAGRERWVGGLDHTELIVQWAREYDWVSNLRLIVSAPVGSPLRFLQRLEKLAMPRWAATLQAGAHLVFPHSPVERLHIYADVTSGRGLHDLAEGFGWRVEPSGTLQILAPRYKTAVWNHARRLDGTPVVSDLQLVLDLWNHPIRGREHAELILEKHLSRLSA